MTRRTAESLRSARWFAPDDFRSFGQRSRMNQMGYSAADYAGKPVIGIVNTWSDLNQCHAHFKQRVEDVKRGVLQAGGFPVELPAISLSETNVKPTTMLYRNFLAMETEELIRSHPIDGVVLMGGCDKTTPGLLLGATSAGVPAIFVPAGPMLRGNWRGKVLGSGSDTDQILGGAPRRDDLAKGSGGDRGRHRALLRRLHDDGHRLDHDRARRRDRHEPARRLLDSRPPIPIISACARTRAGASSRWCGRI